MLDVFFGKADGADDHPVIASADDVVYKLPGIAVAAEGDDVTQVVSIFFQLAEQEAKMLGYELVGDKKNMVHPFSL